MRSWLVMVALAGCAGWSPRDMALDLHQTEQITAAGLELNPAIGPHGDRVPPPLFSALAVAANIAIAHVLHGNWRTAWQAGSAGVETVVVVRNLALGWR